MAETRGGEPAKGARPLLIVDGDNLAHRAYHATPKTVRGAGGAPINAIVGFVGALAGIWTAEQPRGVFVAWDTLGAPTYRHRLWPAYQSGRVFEPEIVRQLAELPALCRAFGFGVGQAAGSEADDLFAAAAAAEVARGGTCLLLTTDRDAYQLVSDRVTVLAPQRGTRELARVGPREVEARLGVPPEGVVDFKALSGDASDNIPGLRGVGPKTAVALLREHGSLDAALAALQAPGVKGGRRAPEDVELARTFREVVRLRPDVAVQLPPTGPPDWRGGAAALRELGATTLAARIEALATPAA
jgi:DNA polymerase-1